MIMCKISVDCKAINFIELVCSFRGKLNLIMEIVRKPYCNILFKSLPTFRKILEFNRSRLNVDNLNIEILVL